MEIQNKERPKKSLGQNFLIDKSVLEDIVSAIGPKKGDTIVEIGPGHGELTEPLIESGASVTVIEKDRALIPSLEAKFKKIKIIEGDALDIIRNSKLEIRNSDKWKLVGNIPYYITGQLFRIIGELKNKPKEMVFMIQKEVAERIGAKKGEMNLLAASIQIWAKPEIVRFVDRKSFSPAPKVDSAVIKLTPVKNYKLKVKSYYSLLHIVFKQPRKTLFNNLREGIKLGHLKKTLNIEEILQKNKLKTTLRPQDLTIEDLKRLSGEL